jgi:hypothetical protein
MLDCVARSVLFLDNPGLWPGFVAGTLSAALILAALLTPLLLWGYGRRVTALMNVRGAAAHAEPGPADDAPSGPIPAGSPESGEQALARARSGPRRSLAAASLGILAYAAAYAVLLLMAEGMELLPMRTAFMVTVSLLPAVPVILLFGLPPQKQVVPGGVLYLAGGAGLHAAMLALGPTLPQVATSFAVSTLAPFGLFVLVGNRRLRAVVPILLVASLMLAIGASWSFSLWGSILLCSRDLALKPYAWAAALALPAAMLALGVWILRALARAYEAKRFSDLEFQADAWVLVLGVLASIRLGWTLGAWGTLGLLVLPVFRTVRRAATRRLLRPARPRQLLLLRVFAGDRRGERLLDALAHGWRYLGPVHLIGGPDLARSYVDPPELIRFLSGRTAELFVKPGADLARRLRELDLAADPDGRFRVNEFYCHDDVWQAAVSALALRSDAILMDLRAFRAERRGTAFELGLLARLGVLPRCVFLADESTDLAAAGQIFAGSGVTLADAADEAPARPDVARILRLPAGDPDPGPILRQLLAEPAAGDPPVAA